MNTGLKCDPERQIPIFETLLLELEKRASVLDENAISIYVGVNKIWDNRTPEDQNNEPIMPNDVVGKLYYLLNKIDKSIDALKLTRENLDKLV